jgi:hypothetical protein
MFRTARHVCLLATLGLMPGWGARAATPLAPSSPFLPPATAGAAAAENTPLELRGILVDGGGYRFSVFDPVRHTGTWARLNEPGHDFVIRSHDVARDLITLDYQGRVLTLPLHSAKVAAAGAAGPAAGALAGPGGNPPVVLNPTPADELARFNRVKEEIARRRALREQASSPSSPTRK